MDEEDKNTLIQLKRGTCEKLHLLKNFGESYDDVINRLLDENGKRE